MKTKGLSIQRAVGLASLVLGLFLPTVRAEAASYIVNTTDDINDGACNAAHCSLREAINAANTNPGPDEISFDIPGPAPHLIVLGTPLPPLTDDGTTIDGTTEPGYSGQPVVAIRPCGPAVLVGCAAYTLGLPIQSSDNLVRGLSWIGFGFYNSSGPWQVDASIPCAIAVACGTGNRTEANYIGLDPTGAVVANSAGVRLQSPGQQVIDNPGNDLNMHVPGILQQGPTATGTRPTPPTITPTATHIIRLTATPTPGPLTATLIQDANCRSGPGTEGYRIVTSFAAGEVVTLMGRNPEGTWSLARRDFADGSILCWIWDGALQGDTSDLPVLEPPPTLTPTPTPPVGCWVPGTAGNVCTVPCPAGATGGPCTP